MPRYEWKVPNFIDSDRCESGYFRFCGRKFKLVATKEESQKGDFLWLSIDVPECADQDKSLGIGVSSSITVVNHKDSNRNISHYEDRSLKPGKSLPRRVWHNVRELKEMLSRPLQTVSNDTRFMHPDFYTALQWSYGWNIVRTEKMARKGLLSPYGELTIDVQLYPLSTVKWEIENFLSLTTADGIDSPPFALGGSRWQAVLYPHGAGTGNGSHVSVFLRKFDDADDWGGIEKQIKFVLSLIDTRGQRQYSKSSTYAFSATKTGWGFPQWISLEVIAGSPCMLPQGSLQLVVEVRLESIIWPMDLSVNGTGGIRESPTFSMDDTTWRAVAGANVCGTLLDQAIGVSSDSHSVDFVQKPTFAITVSGSNAAVATTVVPERRVVYEGSVYWVANVVDVEDRFETKFVLTNAPRAVSWLIKGARSFLCDSIRPPRLKSGKILVDDWEAELILYPQGHGDGFDTHMSCFFSMVSPECDSDVALVLNIEFAVCRGDEVQRAVYLEGVAVSARSVGVERLLRLRDIDEVLDADGALRIDVRWSPGDIQSSGAIIQPTKPSLEHSDVGTLEHMLDGERKWHKLRETRRTPCLLWQLKDAAEMIVSKLADADAWRDPQDAEAAIQSVTEAWTLYTKTQNEVRQLVALGHPKGDAVGRRDAARAAFCSSVNGVDADIVSSIYEAQAKSLPTLTKLQSRFPRDSAGNVTVPWETVVAVARGALELWEEWKLGWEGRYAEAATATDTAARKMQDAFRCLFSTESSNIFDASRSTAEYYDFLMYLYKEEQIPCETENHFPKEEVVQAYYALHDRASIVKKEVGALVDIWERHTARCAEVRKWIDARPRMQVLDEYERDRMKLVAAKHRLQAQWYEAEFEEDTNAHQTKRQRCEEEIASITAAARNNEKKSLSDRASLWKIQQNHFPEIALPHTTIDDENNDIVALLSQHRTLDMYSDITCLHSGHHRILKANFGGEWCVLKQFLSATEMLREAKIQYRLRHPTIVPIRAVFHGQDTSGGSYMQLPLYKCDLAVWLQSCVLDSKGCEKMISSMLSVVEHIHQANIIHGDLKPRNFLLDRDNALVLCDFGSSRPAQENTMTLPMPSVTGGTGGYVAPELENGSKPTKASDMYSVGCIIKNDLMPRVRSNADSFGALAMRLCCANPNLRPTALSALTGALHYSVSDFPSYWKTKCGIMSRLCENTKYMEHRALEFLRESTNHHGDGGCSLKRLKEAVIVRVERNENPVLYRTYLRRKAEISEYHSKRQNNVVPVNLPLGKNGEWMIDASVNECYLMHGTLLGHVSTILEDGVNERIANYGGLYGVGSYFTTQSCKAMQYCRRPLLLNQAAQKGKEYCLLVCRVLLGAAYVTEKIFLPENDTKDFLREPPSKENHQRWDSIVALPGWKMSRDGKQPRRHEQIHNEAIVFDRTQVYPEFAIYFKIP